ncbi:3'(2'),5'-bisphosphate nucleotidase CysQ [Pseudohalioglobus sediminis]|uniref:3'(2'),5'-bisphosphate nucleotidase CysQ n=1 Tax=Pseudohalioglobus sediminis TaxID=2606449 RepID=A0A5B0WP20_9GAMM|nr:3'(2'),5'-bisphosphate nucleotidase CysQ [Pseudohalioglobus sediminis]KAA1188824.1 3'(2'),5'-bisphosphate nucleotidase CysQ [Pseudohalioglobus sediminis]
MDIASPQLPDLVSPLLTLCQQAGRVICEHYHAPGADEYSAKGDDSPLTRADIASHRLLCEGLSAITPAIPILSEESTEKEAADRRQWPVFWLVDPLDGTKEFLGRTGEFTINIALIVEHRPVLGMIYLPLPELAYVGIPGHSARSFDMKSGEVTELATRPLRDGEPMTILASRRHKGQRLQSCLQWLEEQWDDIHRDNSGSALKFCQLAAGEGDIYPRFSPCCEWDTAAGQALLEAAGGALLGLDGKALTYNRRDTLLSPNFLALADPVHPLWQQLLARVKTSAG